MSYKIYFEDGNGIITTNKTDPDLEASRLMINRLAFLWTDGEELYDNPLEYAGKLSKALNTEESRLYYSLFQKINAYLPVLLNSYIGDWSHAYILLGTLGALIKGEALTDKEIKPLDPSYKWNTAQANSILIETITDKAIKISFFKHYLMALDEIYDFEKLKEIIFTLNENLEKFKKTVQLFNKTVYEHEFRSMPTISIRKEMYKRDYDRLIKEMSDLSYATQPYYNIYSDHINKINMNYGLG